MLRWIFGALVLLLVGLAYGLMTAESRIADMSANVQADLASAGHDWATVDMDGNIVTLGGTAPSLEDKQAAVSVAERSYCSACREKHRWHDVVDIMDVAKPITLPIQSPYTFTARKTSDGVVTLRGYAPSAVDRDRIVEEAKSVFGEDLSRIRSIDLARGAPDENWARMLGLYFGKLARLDQGQLLLENSEGALQGSVSDAEAQNELYAQMTDDGLDGYNFIGNIAVPGSSVEVFGQSQSQAICQTLLDDLRRGRKIGFEPGEAIIRGDANFDLLAELATVASQCPSFRIAINGYTSSEGDPVMNQSLSEDRANAVLFYLNEQAGIDRSRLSARGFGSDKPIADNDTPEGRDQNRRIEFILSKAE